MPSFTSSLGIEIHYETFGDRGPPLVMMHGIASAIEVWQPQIEQMQAHCRIYAFDYPGHGHSGDRVTAHTMEKYARVLGEFMDHLGLEKAHIMGLSLGCSVALTFAVRHPGRVLSLLLEGPAGGIHPPWHPLAWPKMLALVLYLILLGLLELVLGKARLVHLINLHGLQTREYSALLDMVEHWATPWPVIFMTLASACPPYVGRLANITAPALIVRGQQDPFPARYVDYIRQHLGGPVTYVELPNAQHVVALDQPALFNRACLDFLATVAGPLPGLEVVHGDAPGGV